MVKSSNPRVPYFQQRRMNSTFSAVGRIAEVEFEARERNVGLDAAYCLAIGIDQLIRLI
jgi:hypothetical protein